MKKEKKMKLVSALCMAFLISAPVLAQDDLDNLLGELEKDSGKKTEQAKPAAEEKKEEAPAPAAEEKKEEAPAPAAEKKEEAPAPAPAVAEKKEEAPAPAPAVVEEKKEEAPAPAPAAVAEEKKDEAPAPAPAVAEEKKEEAPAPAPAAVVEEKKEEAPAPAPAVAEEKKDEAPAPAPAAVTEEKKEAPAPSFASHPDAELISDIIATEELRRKSLDQQAERELLEARKAMADRDWDRAYKQYRLASAHLNDREESRALRRECQEGMAEAQYQAGKQAMKEGDRETARKFADEALALHHPRAAQLKEALSGEKEQDAEKDVTEIQHRRNDTDYKESREVVRRRLRRSAQYLTVSDLDNALDQCDLVLRAEPYNSEALALRARIQRRRDQILQQERNATRKGMIADVSAAWRPVYAVNSPELKSVDGGTMQSPIGGDPERSIEQAIEKRMKEMILPTIAFRPPATIIDAVDYFRQASKDYDRPDIPVEQRGFNFVLDLGKVLTGSGGGEAKATEDSNDFSANADEGEGGAAAGDVPQIPNISASNVSLWDALKTVCKISGFKFKVQGPVVMVMPKDMTTDELITRSYTVTENFAERMSGASSDMKEMKTGGFGDKEGDDESTDQTLAWKKIFTEMGVQWPKGSQISYIKSLGKLRVTNTADQLAVFEQALNEMNVTPTMIEIETRFVEVAQEDLNSLGFEWLLNSDYSFNVGGKLGKVLGLKDIAQYYETGSDTTVNQTLVPTADGGWAYTGGQLVKGTTTPSFKKWNDRSFDGTVAYADDGRVNQNVGNWNRWSNARVAGLGDVTKYVYESYDDNGMGVGTPVVKTPATTTTPATYQTQTFYDIPIGYKQTKTGRNVGMNGINGTDYSTGMRYLSNYSNDQGTQLHLNGKPGSSAVNDQFMKLNAFLGNADLSMILHMLSQRSDTDLLSAPKVVTKSGQEATIKVVTEYIYPQDYDVTIQSTSSSSSSSVSTSGSGGGDGKILPMVEPQNFTMREVGVILNVTPEVSAEGQMINLELKPQIISEPTWKDYGMKVPMASVMSENAQVYQQMTGGDMWFNVPMEQPFFKVRSVETHVSLYNGSTLVMGGLITEERKSMEDKIPFLGDIPWIGRFFRSRSEWSDKRNLLLFVTARLVDPNGRQMMMGAGDDAAKAKTADASKAAAPAPAAK